MVHSHNLVLDFEGRRLQGARPFAFYDFRRGAWSWQPLRPGPPLPAGTGGALAQLRHALHWARDYFGPQGAAMGYFAYEFARALEPRAFSSRATHHGALPEARLVFYEQLDVSSPPPPPEPPHLSAGATAAQRTTNGEPGYDQAVERILRYIAAGDIYQANLTRRFCLPLRQTPAGLYARLRAHPMPFSALLAWDDFAIVSNSPERFLRVCDGIVTAEPIKGTAPRGANEQADRRAVQELRDSPKDRAENVMIVDLLRNDLGRVCEFGSVSVPRLCEVQTFPTLHHLVSTVTGQLRAGCDALDAFAAAFPCGSITGAPKIRAMQIIDELEPVPRGASMGAIGYFGFNGDADWNVAIRTITCVRDKAYFHAGGGIVADSTAGTESAEIAVKARALLNALSGY